MKKLALHTILTFSPLQIEGVKILDPSSKKTGWQQFYRQCLVQTKGMKSERLLCRKECRQHSVELIMLEVRSGLYHHYVGNISRESSWQWERKARGIQGPWKTSAVYLHCIEILIWSCEEYSMEAQMRMLSENYHSLLGWASTPQFLSN
jgi:hypothetical protein